MQKELERLETMRIYEKNTLLASISAESMRWAEDRLPVLLWQEQLFFRQMYKFYI